jgi:hypothetical protein
MIGQITADFVELLAGLSNDELFWDVRQDLFKNFVGKIQNGGLERSKALVPRISERKTLENSPKSESAQPF